ncbi:MAG TPA: hypothetical protein VFB32_07465 [Rudaea sp.]|nr:hypothetical protein [Rudaea sp.]
MTRSARLCALLLATAVFQAHASDFTFAPTTSGGTLVWAVTFGTNAQPDNAPLTLIVGQTYTFTANTNVVHPFYIKTVQEANGSAGAYPTGGTSGLDNNGVTSSTTTMTFTPPASAAGTLFYNCGNHPTMTGVINVIVDPIFADGFGDP